jgi:aspartate ammonia-lyase
VIPTPIRLGAVTELPKLQAAFENLIGAFEQKGREFDDVLKSGRTHLQDAMPIRLGQELTAYAGSLRRSLSRVVQAADYLRDLGIGGTAVGTGVNEMPSQGIRRSWCASSRNLPV